MIQGTHRNHPASPAILALSLVALWLLGSCGEAGPGPAPPAEKTVNLDRFQEGLAAVDRWLSDGDAAKAEVIAARLVELDPDSIVALQAHGNCLLILGSLADQSGDAANAVALRQRADAAYRAAVTQAGSGPEAPLLHQAALAAAANEDLERACVLHIRAASVDPTDPTHPIFAANTLTRLEHPEEAITWFDRAIEIAPAEPWAWAGRAECLRQLQRFDESLEAIRTARSRSVARGTESGFPFRVAEARILREAGQARRAADLLYAIDPSEFTRGATSELAAACTEIGEHRRAAEAWERFNLQNQGDVASMLAAAECWIRAGEPEEAAAWLNLAETAGTPPSVLDAVRQGR